MAASTISRRRNAQAEARAAKEKKQKIFLGLAVGLLLLVLVFELPKLMKGSGSSTSSSTAAPAVVAPATATPVVAAKSPAQIKQDLREIRKLSAHDVFGRAGAVGAQPAFQDVQTPAGVRDPFEGTGTASANPVITKPKASAGSYSAALPAQIVIGTKTKNAVTTKGWIVILASIPTAKGEASATSFVSKASKKGVAGLKVLNSSNSKPLRGGYWVVYAGPFTTIPQVNQHATSVHAAGYGSAYIRQLVVYHAK
jgi:hypothetical protein